MEDDPTKIICLESDPRGLYFGFHVALSAGYFIIFLLSLYQNIRLILSQQRMTLIDLIPKFAFTFTLLLKAILSTIESYAYQTSCALNSWKLFIILFPGYIISCSYLLIFCSWCNLFGSFIGGEYEKISKIVQKVIITFIFSLIIFFIIFVCFKAQYPNSEKWSIAENIVATIRDIVILFLYIAMLIILKVKLEIHCIFSCQCLHSSQDLIISLCIFLIIALLIRVATRLYFLLYTGLRECSIEYFYPWVAKEIFGQMIILSFVVFSDFCLDTRGIDMVNTDPLISTP